jgi:hypothetical protein
MKTGIIRFITLMMILASAIYGCSPKARYERRLKHELAKGVRYDSLFMGIYFGMPQKDFYLYCWKLNSQGLIKQGPGNTTVEYQLRNELKYPGTMNFYPGFVDGKIAEMPVKFTYSGWAPWNTKLSSDSLQYDVLKWYKKIYGGDFIKIKHPQRGIAYVKLDGNRQISVFKEDEIHVWAVFTDMSVTKELSDSTNAGYIRDTISKDINN